MLARTERAQATERGAGAEKILSGVGRDDDAELSEQLTDHGELCYHTRATIFLRATADIILPGCERAGLDTEAARVWLGQLSRGE